MDQGQLIHRLHVFNRVLFRRVHDSLEELFSASIVARQISQPGSEALDFDILPRLFDERRQALLGFPEFTGLEKELDVPLAQRGVPGGAVEGGFRRGQLLQHLGPVLHLFLLGGRGGHG